LNLLQMFKVLHFSMLNLESVFHIISTFHIKFIQYKEITSKLYNKQCRSTAEASSNVRKTEQDQQKHTYARAKKQKAYLVPNSTPIVCGQSAITTTAFCI